MTNADHFLQTFVRQQLGHIRVQSSEFYIHTDSTAAREYVTNTVNPVTDVVRPDDEDEETP